MKFVLQTLMLLSVLLLIAFLGKMVNALITEEIAVNEIIKEAGIEYSKFATQYNPHRKTIVVIGRSTSMYSYPETGYIQTKRSYAELVSEKANVLNLSSVKLNYISQAKALVKFSQENIPKIDLIVLENLQYLVPMSIVEGRVLEGQTFNRIIFCGKVNLMNWFTFSKPAANDRFYLNLCNANLLYPLNPIRDLRLNMDPCLKKYQEMLSTIASQSIENQASLFSDILRCNRSFFYTDQFVPRYLIHYFFHGNLESLTEAFQTEGLDVNAIDYHSQENYGLNGYEPAPMIFANYYLSDFLQKNSKSNFLIIPIFYNPPFFRSLPLFRQNNPRMIFLDISDDIDKIKKEKNLEHRDVFVDGSHARIWVHQLIAEKIISIFLTGTN